MSTKYQEGDTVRLSAEGVVTRVFRGDVSFQSEQGLVTVPESEPYLWLIGRRKPKVGDKIATRRELAALPDKSVVVNAYGHAYIVGYGKTVDFSGKLGLAASDYSNGPYTVIHIPG